MGEPIQQKPFVRSHLRRDGEVEADLTVIAGGVACYRVRFKDGGKTIIRSTATSERHFRAAFQ